MSVEDQQNARPPASAETRDARIDGIRLIANEAKPKRPFVNDLRRMLYGFGDSELPLQETLDLVDDIVCDFISNLTKSAVQLSDKKGKGGKISTEDVLFLVRKNPRMYFRAKELIRKAKEIENARKIPDPVKEKGQNGGL